MAAGSDVTYGIWTHPNSRYQIRYSLAAFRDIEFYVGEGFRRIAYGGIEHGGLLFGTRINEAIQIEAFRPIECEHASGPSFTLSEMDLAAVRAQLSNYAAESALAGLAPLGIFVSHSRRDMSVTSDEESLLALLFPEPWQCLLIIKPEKFKPAQFAFVFRGALTPSGSSLEDAAFTLPLPTRSRRKSREQIQKPEAPPETEQAAPIGNTAKAQPKATRSRTRRTAVKLNDGASETEPQTETSSQPVPVPAFGPPPPPATPVAMWRNLRSRAAAAIVIASLLPLAACFIWFYWNYVQPPIEVAAFTQPGSIVLTWPAQVTAGADEARLVVSANRKNQVIALSAAEKSSGRATVAVKGNDVTIELVASHWLHARRGMVRVITNP